MTTQVIENNKEVQEEKNPYLKEFQSLKEEIAELKKQLQPEKDSIETKLDALIAQKIEQFKQSEAQRIEEAKRTLEEAEANARIEKELATNTKYRVHSDYLAAKEQEFMDRMKNLAKLCKEEKYMHNLYEKARMGDPDSVGVAKLTFLATHFTPQAALNILKRNIGVTMEE